MNGFERRQKGLDADVAKGGERHRRGPEAPGRVLGRDVVDGPERRFPRGQTRHAIAEAAALLQQPQRVVDMRRRHLTVERVDDVVSRPLSVDERRHDLEQPADQYRPADLGEQEDALAFDDLDVDVRLEPRPCDHAVTISPADTRVNIHRCLASGGAQPDRSCGSLAPAA